MPLLVGVVTAILLGFVFVKNVTGPLSRFSTDRPVEGDLSAGAERTIYVRAPDESSTTPQRISCSVLNVETGQQVPTRDTFGHTLTLNEESFIGVERFRAEGAGRYRVSCSASQPALLAIGPRVKVFREVGRVFAAIITLMAGLGLSAVVVTIVALRRHHHRRFLQGRA